LTKNTLDIIRNHQGRLQPPPPPQQPPHQHQQQHHHQQHDEFHQVSQFSIKRSATICRYLPLA